MDVDGFSRKKDPPAATHKAMRSIVLLSHTQKHEHKQPAFHCPWALEYVYDTYIYIYYIGDDDNDDMVMMVMMMISTVVRFEVHLVSRAQACCPIGSLTKQL